MIGLNNLFTDEDEAASYDIIFVNEDEEELLLLGQVELQDDPFTWSFWQIANIGDVPKIHSYTINQNPNGAITVNASLPGFNFDGKPYLKLGLRYGTVNKKPEMGSDWCLKCEERGVFLRTTLKCPTCGDILGGC